MEDAVMQRDFKQASIIFKPEITMIRAPGRFLQLCPIPEGGRHHNHFGGYQDDA